MILPLPAFTLLHVLLSLVGLVAGLIAVGGLASGKRLDGWIALFLVTTFLTNLSGFGFQSVRILPSHIVGGISLIVLPVAAFALYLKRLAGPWHRIFVITAVLGLYFNVFVLVAQLFSKTPGLIAVAPTQQSPAFGASQLLVLLIFIGIGRAALRGFRAPLPSEPLRSSLAA
jgi:uncharacterized membrane protein